MEKTVAERGTQKSAGVPAAGRLHPPLLAVLAVLSAGLFAALFHLSDPLQAARAVVNFSSSWLSREIVFGSLFAALLSALAAQEWRAAGAAPAGPARERPQGGYGSAPRAAPATPDARSSKPAESGAREPGARRFGTCEPRTLRTGRPANPAPGDLAGPAYCRAAGLAFLGCQIAIYLLPAQPAWNSLATPAGVRRHGAAGWASSVWRPGSSSRAWPRESTTPARADPGGSGRRVAGDPAGDSRWAGIAALALEFVVVPLHLASLSREPLARPRRRACSG